MATFEIAFVMDPLESLSLKKDSTLAMIRAAQLRGHSVSYLQQEDLALIGGTVQGCGRALKLRDDFAESLDPSIAGDDWFELSESRWRPLGDFDLILMRKDPPFDMEYIYSTYLLERAMEDGAMVANHPASLRDCNEKFFATSFPECCPPLVVSRREDVLRDFQAEHGNVVFKKLDGMGGMNVFRVMAGDPNLGVILETLTGGGREQIMGQVYLPEIAAGDKRILVVDGKPVDYALARIPKTGEARGNLAAGGTGVGQPLSDRDRHIAETVAPALVERGLSFVGLDVIGDYLTEVNVTCPTCIRELDTQFSLDIAGNLIEALTAKLGA